MRLICDFQINALSGLNAVSIESDGSVIECSGDIYWSFEVKKVTLEKKTGVLGDIEDATLDGKLCYSSDNCIETSLIVDDFNALTRIRVNGDSYLATGSIERGCFGEE